jgi:thiol-disulfide isomerase/thioredoxin
MMRFRPIFHPWYLALLAVPILALMVWLAPSIVPTAKAGGYPSFPAGTTWFNVSRPLTENELNGRVVLLDFFTPGCINCIHMIPIEQKLKQK